MRILAILMAFAACCTGLSAATFTVTSTGDSGAGSLRQAIADANANSGADVIDFNLSLPAVITPLTRLPATEGDLTIAGPGARLLTIDGAGGNIHGITVGRFAGRVASDAIIEDLTITGFWVNGGAGAAFNLTNTSGGGFVSSITLNRVTVRDCRQTASGGVVSFSTGSFTATDCEFSNCMAGGTGGTFNSSGSASFPTTLTLTNCTLNGNSAGNTGGAIHFTGSGAITLNSCTIAGNTSGQGGGGISIASAGISCTMTNTIVAGNTSTAQPSDDIAGTFTSAGYNLVQVTAGATFTPQSTDITSQDPLLNGLANNGGPTSTMELSASSPCIDAGTSGGGSLTTDQRGTGFVRTHDDAGVADVDDGTDIGAFERQPVATPTIILGSPPSSFASPGVGVPSTEQSFTVGGTSLTQPIAIAPPQHWEVSFTSGTGYTTFPNTITTVVPTGGVVPTTTVFIRYNPIAAPPHTDNVVLSSTGATPANISVSGVLPTVTSLGVDFSAAEATPATSTGTWRLNVSAALTAGVTVNFDVSSSSTPASPVPGVDFDLSTSVSGVVLNFVGATGNTVVIPAGVTVVDILLTVVDDIIAEGTENVVFAVTAGVGYVPSASNSFVNISDNDSPVTPAVSVGATDNSADEGNTAGDTGEYTISFSQTPNIASTTINFTMSGTASTTGGTDYNLSSPTTGVAISYTGPTGTITIPAGTPSVVVILTAVGDSLTEGNETAVLTIDAGTDYTVGSPPAATVTIVDDDLPVVTVAVADNSADEANATTDTAAWTVALNPAPTASTVIGFTMSGTAMSGDYNLSTSVGSLSFTFPTGTLTVPASTTSVTLTLTAVNDVAVEGATPETAIFTVNAGTGYALGGTVSGTVDIVDDDVAVVPTITVSATDNSASEANSTTDTGTYEVLITPAPNTPLTINFNMSGTASTGAGTDYTLSATGGTLGYSSPNGTVDIGIGTTSFTVTLTANNDSAMEGATPETAVLTLTASGSYTIGTASNATVDILDNDTPPDVSVAATDASATEATPASDSGVYTITFTPPANAAMTLNFTMSGTASPAAGADYTLSATGGALNYTSPTGTIAVALGTTAVTVTVTVTDDTSAEGAAPETAILTLNAGTGYNLGTPGNATVSIADNDTLPVNITTTTLPNGKVNNPYSQAITANGGAAPYAWTVQAGGSLPAGVTLASSTTNSTMLSGTPTAGGSFSFVVEVTDGATTDAQPFTLVISANKGGGGGGDDDGGCVATRSGASALLSVLAVFGLLAFARRRRTA